MAFDLESSLWRLKRIAQDSIFWDVYQNSKRQWMKEWIHHQESPSLNFNSRNSQNSGYQKVNISEHGQNEIQDILRSHIFPRFSRQKSQIMSVCGIDCLFYFAPRLNRAQGSNSVILFLPQMIDHGVLKHDRLVMSYDDPPPPNLSPSRSS
jgi:hypothetical protein